MTKRISFILSDTALFILEKLKKEWNADALKEWETEQIKYPSLFEYKPDKYTKADIVEWALRNIRYAHWDEIISQSPSPSPSASANEAIDETEAGDITL